jgi:hypothetical protein
VNISVEIRNTGKYMQTRTLPTSTARQGAKTRSRKAVIPEALIYEMVHGEPVYYKGYQDMIQGKKPLEDIMESSYLQSLIISRLVRFLLTCLPDIYEVLTNEIGLQFSKKHWRAADIAIYHKEQLRTVPLQNTYIDIPPKVVFEIDTKADVGQFTTSADYYYTKTDELLEFGVEKVIWIFTDAQKIMIAEPKHDWVVSNWDQAFHVFDDMYVNVSQMIL